MCGEQEAGQFPMLPLPWPADRTVSLSLFLLWT